MIEQITFRKEEVEIFIDLVGTDYVVEVYSNEDSTLCNKALFETLKESLDFVDGNYLGGILSEPTKTL